MKSLWNGNNKGQIHKYVYSGALTQDELKLLNDLIAFNCRYEDAFFNKDIDNSILEMIDNVIDDKLKSISPDLAFKFLNRLWTIYGNVNSTLDANILNGFEFDLVIHRLSIQLLDRATEDEKSFLYNYRSIKSDDLLKYFKYNFYYKFYPLGSKANKMLTLDHVDIFLALLNGSNDIEETTADSITSIYLFLYKDIFKEILNNRITIKSCSVLAQRFNGYERYVIKEHTCIKVANIAIQFASEAMSMLTYKDKDLTDDDIEYLKVGKIYLDSLLMPLKDFEVDKVLSFYNANEATVDTRECTKALSYVKKSINNKDEQLKRNS